VSFEGAEVADLLRACTEGGNADAWREFVARYHRVIASTILKSCRKWGTTTPALIDDLIQETYVKLCNSHYRVLREFELRHPEALHGLLKTVSFSVVQDHFRASIANKRGAGHKTVAFDEQTRDDTISDIERDILLRQIGERLADESSRDRTIFWLHFRQGMTARAIAEIQTIGLGPKGVEAVLARLTRLLREKLGGDAPAGKTREAAF
jgi:RNA polymerase sigma-70 factor (ECF subfamily)